MFIEHIPYSIYKITCQFSDCSAVKLNYTGTVDCKFHVSNVVIRLSCRHQEPGNELVKFELALHMLNVQSHPLLTAHAWCL